MGESGLRTRHGKALQPAELRHSFRNQFGSGYWFSVLCYPFFSIGRGFGSDIRKTTVPALGWTEGIRTVVSYTAAWRAMKGKKE